MNTWTYIKVSAFVFLAPILVFAQSGAPAVDIGTPQKLAGLIDKVGGYMYMILLALGVIFLVYAGYVFLFANGDDNEVAKAKKIILYSVVAIAIAILARGIVALTQNVVGGSGTSPSSDFLDSPFPGSFQNSRG